MRIWSLHPNYLDAKGIVALWRETLLAKNVLEQKTKGYTHHPQLTRFKQALHPLQAINYYLQEVYQNSQERGYHFSPTKFETIPNPIPKIKVTTGQVLYEFQHLKNKLQERDPKKYQEIQSITQIELHPLFEEIPGEIEAWEVVNPINKKKS